MLLQGAVWVWSGARATRNINQQVVSKYSLGFVLVLLYSYVASKQKTSVIALWLLRFWRSHPWDVVGSLCWRIKSDPEDAERLSHESTDRQERGACSPKFNSHFGVVVISSIMPYRWETLPKLTFLSHLWIHCTVNTKNLISLLPWSNRVALLSCRVTWTILWSEPSNPPELGAAVRVPQIPALLYGLGKIGVCRTWQSLPCALQTVLHIPRVFTITRDLSGLSR